MGGRRVLVLMTIGTAGGLVSGLFGGGGGVIVVPGVGLWRGDGERRARGPSLGAIAIVAAAAAAVQAVYGNVHVCEGVLVGIPAIGGVLIGTALQHRVHVRALSLLSSLLLVAVAI